MQGIQFHHPHNNYKGSPDKGGRKKYDVTDTPPGTPIRATLIHCILANDDQRAEQDQREAGLTIWIDTFAENAIRGQPHEDEVYLPR